MIPSDARIFIPFLIQVLLTVALFIALAIAKARAEKAGLVDEKRRALHADAWPEGVIKINNNIRNQFEVPVLFYAVTIALYLLNAAGVTALILAWAFVLSRIAHAYVHTGINVVRIRRRIFMFGCLMVLAMTAMAMWAALTS
jgi:hypothetical protein